MNKGTRDWQLNIFLRTASNDVNVEESIIHGNMEELWSEENEVPQRGRIVWGHTRVPWRWGWWKMAENVSDKSSSFG